MKKLALLSLVVGASVAFVGCASTQTPETAQSSQATESNTSAQSSSVETDSQNGVAVQVDPTLQQAEPIQVSPVGDVPEATQPAQ